MEERIRELFELLWDPKIKREQEIMGYKVYKYYNERDPFLNLLGREKCILLIRETGKFLIFKKYKRFTIKEYQGKLKWSKDFNSVNLDFFIGMTKEILEIN